MISQSRYPVEPWHVRELGLDMSMLAQSESVFALANGHVGVRGNLFGHLVATAVPGVEEWHCAIQWEIRGRRIT